MDTDTTGVEESTADSQAYTEEQKKVAEDELDAVAGEQDASLVEDRPLDETSMSDDELEALDRQNEVASPDYEPKSFDGALKGFETDSEFALSNDAPDHSGPDAHADAVRVGVNPRSVATSSDPEGLKQTGRVRPVSENAAPVSTDDEADPTPDSVL